MIIPYGNTAPVVDPSVFIAPGAHVIGDVVIGRESSVWFNAVIRGDINTVRIGERTNIQDGAVLHVTHDTGPLRIGTDVTVGHSAIVHACTIGDRCLIGMGAILLDNATINSYTLVAAGAVVKMGMKVPEGVLVAGVPARVVRDLTPGERESIRRSAEMYAGYALKYLNAQL